MRLSPLRLALCVLLAAPLLAPASAQSLPDWAAPSASDIVTVEEGSGFDLRVPCPPGSTDDGMGGCIPNPPPQVPVDGGLSLLALAGMAYASRRLRRA